MRQLTRIARFVAVFAIVPMVAGCGLVPPEGESKLALRPRIDSGPSNQRLRPDGYPMIGAFPKSAGKQLTDGEVGTGRATLSAAAKEQNRAATSGNRAYTTSVAESLRVQADTRAEVNKAVAVTRDPNAKPQTSEDVLRIIEGR